MKLLLTSIVLATLTVSAHSSVKNESNLRVLKSAKGSKTPKSVKSVKVEKSMKSDKAKAAKSEKSAKADESKSAKAGVEGSKTPKGKGGGKGGEGKSLKSKKGKAAKSGKVDGPVITTPPTVGPAPGCGCFQKGQGGVCTVLTTEGVKLQENDCVPLGLGLWSELCCKGRF